jgi:hypothetical protein
LMRDIGTALAADVRPDPDEMPEIYARRASRPLPDPGPDRSDRESDHKYVTVLRDASSRTNVRFRSTFTDDPVDDDLPAVKCQPVITVRRENVRPEWVLDTLHQPDILPTSDHPVVTNVLANYT